jgi:hypothetical protein
VRAWAAVAAAKWSEKFLSGLPRRWETICVAFLVGSIVFCVEGEGNCAEFRLGDIAGYGDKATEAGHARWGAIKNVIIFGPSPNVDFFSLYSQCRCPHVCNSNVDALAAEGSMRANWDKRSGLLCLGISLGPSVWKIPILWESPVKNTNADVITKIARWSRPRISPNRGEAIRDNFLRLQALNSDVSKTDINVGSELSFTRDFRVLQRLACDPPKQGGRSCEDHSKYGDPRAGVMPPGVVLTALLIGIGGAILAMLIIAHGANSGDEHYEHKQKKQRRPDDCGPIVM